MKRLIAIIVLLAMVSAFGFATNSFTSINGHNVMAFPDDQRVGVVLGVVYGMFWTTVFENEYDTYAISHMSDQDVLGILIFVFLYYNDFDNRDAELINVITWAMEDIR